MNSIIKERVPVTEMLAGLAEECSELAQAALKYRRSLDQTNPTPVTEDEAFEKLCEEVADVKLYLLLLSLPSSHITIIMGQKLKRWEGRLNGQTKAL